MIDNRNVQIHFIMTHPLYDNYILISTDHQLRLFDIDTERVVKMYNARQVEEGVYIE